MKTVKIARSLSASLIAARSAGTATKEAFSKTAAILGLSLADTPAMPRRVMAAAIEKDQVSSVVASKFLSRTCLSDIETFVFPADGYPSPEDFAAAAAAAGKRNKAAFDAIRVVIPKAWAVVRALELPAAAGPSIAQVLAYEMDRYTPFTSDEVFFDYVVVGESIGKTRILLAAARKTVLQPYLAALESQGIRVDAVGIDLLDAAWLCGLGKAGPFIFLRRSPNGIDACLSTNGVVTAVAPLANEERNPNGGERVGPIGMLLPAAAADRTVSEVVIWVGPGEEPLLLAEEGGNPVPRPMGSGDVPARLPQSHREALPFGAIGGAIASIHKGSGPLNLLSQGLRAKKRPRLLLTSLLAAAIVAVLVLSLALPLYFEGKRLQGIEREIAARKEAVRKVELVRAQNEAIRGEIAAIVRLTRNGAGVAHLMRELTAALPKSAWVVHLRIMDRSIEMEGYARSAAEVLSRLAASKSFSRAQLVSPVFKDPRTNVERFSIKSEIGERPPDRDAGGARP